jgi:tripartite-type tricarboxylate transporter receptor subunit TctC
MLTVDNKEKEKYMFNISMHMPRALHIALASFLSPVLAMAASMDTPYPSRLVSIVIPYPAGGSGDATARFLASHLAESWSSPVVVENKPGGSGIIGTQAVDKAPHDGYTVLFSTTLHIQNEAIGKKSPYDPIRDFAPIIQVLRSPAALVVPVGLPVISLQQFITLLKSQPGKHSFGSAGNATTSHLYGELLNRKAQLGSVHVPYKGGAPMMTDLIGGQISYSIIDVGSVMPMVKAGKVKIFAMTGTGRSSLLPDMPTFQELGFGGFESYGWMGIFLARGTPPAIAAKWEGAVSAITRSPGYASFVNGLGMEPVIVTGQQFSSVLSNDIGNWKKIASEASITAE